MPMGLRGGELGHCICTDSDHSPWESLCAGECRMAKTEDETQHKTQNIKVQLDSAWRSDRAGAPVVGGIQLRNSSEAAMVAMETKAILEANADSAAAILEQAAALDAMSIKAIDAATGPS